MTDEAILSIARSLDSDPERVQALFNELKFCYERGQHTQDSFWYGVMAGVMRHAWYLEGVRYVGPVASIETRLVSVLAQIKAEWAAAKGSN